jgi:hypothetical protein
MMSLQTAWTIGVATAPTDADVVQEFFELFKTPWEWACEGRHYRTLLTTVDSASTAISADVVLSFGSTPNGIDELYGTTGTRVLGGLEMQRADAAVPLYGSILAFPRACDAPLTCAAGALAIRHQRQGRTDWRIGYDIFFEIRHLLTEGQPAAWAHVPTLDHHIDVVRQLLAASGIEVVEVPPRPSGHPFVCCLTHDLDFFGIKRHWLDRTLIGFAARATVGTVVDVIKGRRPLDEAARNLSAAASLPLVLAGVSADFWTPTDDYLRADRGHPSTYFVVPYKDRPGTDRAGRAIPGRAVRYQASEVTEHLRAAQSAGSEIALHGLDAWRDTDAARAERAELSAASGSDPVGVRMHWLCRDQSTARGLDAAGYEYDSTCGYNDAVGYRAGTGQAFLAPDTRGMYELPLCIMDTALFFPDRMGLSRSAARDRWAPLLAHAAAHGGAVVINWHDRSLAPERLWGRAYDSLLDDIEDHGPWFATASDAVSWFRWRRSITFAVDEAGAVTISAPEQSGPMPGAIAVIRRTSTLPAEQHPLCAGDTVRVHA